MFSNLPIVKLFIISILFYFFLAPVKIEAEIIPERGCVLLSFNGYTAKTPLWENYCSFSRSNLSDLQKQDVQQRVVEIFKNYDVIITTDDSVFYAHPKNSRIRCVITKDVITMQALFWGIFPGWAPIGGKAIINSMHDNDTTAVVVSTVALDSRVEFIAPGCAHEIGHALGLQHKSVFRDTVKWEEYDRGDSINAPIMGDFFFAKNAVWTKGWNSDHKWVDDEEEISKIWRRLTKYELNIRNLK